MLISIIIIVNTFNVFQALLLSASPHRTFFFFFFNIYLFIWLPRVLVAALGIFTDACRIFSCGMQDLVPGPPALGAQSLNHWTTREVPT